MESSEGICENTSIWQIIDIPFFRPTLGNTETKRKSKKFSRGQVRIWSEIRFDPTIGQDEQDGRVQQGDHGRRGVGSPDAAAARLQQPGHVPVAAEDGAAGKCWLEFWLEKWLEIPIWFCDMPNPLSHFWISATCGENRYFYRVSLLEIDFFSF